MSIVTDYVSRETFEKTIQLSKTVKTPFLALDMGIIEKNYDDLVRNFSYARIFYAVKANPSDSVLKLLMRKGSNFDIATVFELDQLLALGVHPEKISYGNTIKKEDDIRYAYEKGIRLFVTDSESDMMKISRQAPGSKVFFRLLISCEGADWPLSKKFGAHPDVVYDLALKAKNLGLVPYGLSFHVGSQQRDVGQWDNAISMCKYLFTSLKEKGVELKMINLGGGLPSNYMQPTPLL
jgi:ornithine decarboxylase